MARAKSTAAHTVHLTIRSPAWKRALPDVEKLAKNAALLALSEIDWPCEVSLVLSDDDEVHRLNREWRNQDKPTNVLSFPSDETEAPDGEPLLIGDVIVAFETTRVEVVRGDAASLHDHLAHLIIHGILHLLGHDHVGDGEAERMEGIETRLLATMGIADPYAEGPHTEGKPA